jgi:hypothetical protein
MTDEMYKHTRAIGGFTPAPDVALSTLKISNEIIVPGTRGRLGRLPCKSDPRALIFARFAEPPKTLPMHTDFWPRRVAFPLRSFGNTDYGSCTRSKQAIASMRMERIEQRRTVSIDDAEVVRTYVEMSDRLYGGGDNGAYETDALDCWRRPEYTYRDTKGRSLTIDAYVRLNPYDHEELKSAMFAAGAHGIAVCLNLPLAFSRLDPPADWHIPEGQVPTGEWMPGSWGGHSMWTRDYDEVGMWLVHTWDIPDQRITWRAAAMYLDEAHLVIDSWNYWKTKKPAALRRLLDLPGIKAAVNRVSSRKII